MLTDNVRGVVTQFMVSFRLIHYLPLSPISWRAQVQAARLDDPTFTDPIFDHATTSSRDGWYYRDESISADDGLIKAWPVGGVTTQRDEAEDIGGADVSDPVAARAVYIVSSPIELARFQAGERFFVRARQSADGVTWGSWMQWMEKL